MSNNINRQPDFSQAPEGATHYHHGASGVAWFSERDNAVYRWSDDNGWLIWATLKYNARVLVNELTPIPAQPNWSGEGRPPVGSIVEFHSFFGIAQFRDGTECRVVSAVTDGDVTVVTASFGPHGYHAFVGECFRPLRTEREKFIERCKGLVIEPHKSEMHICAAAIFDDGARFGGGDDE